VDNGCRANVYLYEVMAAPKKAYLMADLENTKLRPLASVPASSKTPPTWVQCELCERTVSKSLPRLVATFANSEHKVAAAARGSLVLLCPDCLALIGGHIDENEWHKRTGR